MDGRPGVTFTLEELARVVGGRVAGDGAVRVAGVAGLDEALETDLTFLARDRHLDLVATTRAGALIARAVPVGFPRPCIVADEPDWAAAVIAAHFEAAGRTPETGVHPSAVVDASAVLGARVFVGACAVIEAGARLGDDVRVGPGSVVGRNATVGDGTVLHAHVTLAAGVDVGRRVILHPGVVIGSDGFGYATRDGVHCKIPQVGSVSVGDDVEIGANTTVDRARFARTVIGRGTKIDNLVQIGHNVIIGEHCLIVAQCGIAGSCELGRHVTLAGQVGLAGHLRIGDGAIVGAKSGVPGDIGPGERHLGVPARPARETRRIWAAMPHLPELRRDVSALRRRVDALAERLGSAEGGGGPA